MAERSIHDLQQMQALPLRIKVQMTKRRIRDWVNEYGLDGVYVSFSGGKDSTVLLTIAREEYPDMKAVFADTGLEYPEIRDFVKTWDNVDWVKPKMTFKQVIEKYGYPFISKEVAECVWGARKYLTSVIESAASLTDRQTDRARSGITRSIVSYAELENTVPARMAETQRDRQIWQAIQRCKIGGGGTARDFANLTGIRTSAPRTVDPRLWKNYRQFADTTPNGDKQSTGQSDDGEYP